MASSSIFSAAILLQLLVLSAPPATFAYDSAVPITKYIDTVCQRARDKDYCLTTLTSYPPAVAAVSQIPLAQAVIKMGIGHAEKAVAFIDETAKKDPAKKTKEMDDCASAYRAMVAAFQKAAGELEASPDMANDDVEAMHEQTRKVKGLVGYGQNGDEFSKTMMEMTEEMEHYVDLAGGATDAVDDDHENVHAHH